MNLVLKQRLVGAAVLVALAVIFIPMLLEGPERDLVPEMAPLPEPDDRYMAEPLERFPRVGEVPDTPQHSVLQDDADGGDSDAVAAADDPTATELPLALPENAAATPDSGPDTAETPVAPQDAGTAVTPPPVAGAGGEPAPLGNWVVQVGSFSSEQNALRLRDRLRDKAFATQVEKVVVAGKTHYRVRTGPYLEREEAEQDRGKLASAFDLKGRVLSHP